MQAQVGIGFPWMSKLVPCSCRSLRRYQTCFCPHLVYLTGVKSQHTSPLSLVESQPGDIDSIKPDLRSWHPTNSILSRWAVRHKDFRFKEIVVQHLPQEKQPHPANQTNRWEYELSPLHSLFDPAPPDRSNGPRSAGSGKACAERRTLLGAAVRLRAASRWGDGGIGQLHHWPGRFRAGDGVEGAKPVRSLACTAGRKDLAPAGQRHSCRRAYTYATRRGHHRAAQEVRY